MARPCLPQEVDDLIIEALAFDHSALLKLCLVSKTWYRRARAISSETFPVRISAVSQKAEHNTDILLELLQSPHSALAECIHGIQIEGLLHGFRDDPYSPPKVPDDEYNLLSAYISRISKHLTSLRSLILSSLRWDEISPLARESLSNLSTVQHVEMYQIVASDYNVVYDAVFGTIQSMGLRSLRVLGIDVPDPASRVPPLPTKYLAVLQRLPSLTLDIGDSMEFKHPLLLETILRIPSHLHTLDIRIHKGDHLELVNQVLKHVAGALRVLKLGGYHLAYVYDGLLTPEYGALPLSVSHNTSLQRLHLPGFTLEPLIVDQPSHFPAYLSQLIDSIQSPYFIELVFHMFAFKDTLETFQDLSSLAKGVARPFLGLDSMLADRKASIPSFRISFTKSSVSRRFDSEPDAMRTIAIHAAHWFPNLYANSQFAISIDGQAIWLPQPPALNAGEPIRDDLRGAEVPADRVD